MHNNQLGLHISNAAREWFAEHGYDHDFGARPLRRLLQKELLNPLSTKLLAGELEGVHLVTVDVIDGTITFTATNSESAAYNPT